MAPLTEDQKGKIEEEENILREVYSSLQEQQKRNIRRFSIENERARELTAALVGAQRAEDKQMLASDEAVSHELSDQKKREVATIETLLKKPYFARIVLEEETPSGDIKEIEYKLGFAANPDCRIVDWRKAPIAKLYYEYKAGDEYSERILDRERNGIVAKRHTVEVVDAKLHRLSTGTETFERNGGGTWIVRNVAAHRLRTQGELPEILSLITEEQYGLIAQEATTAVLIQGIAGSGKTTVALHRLAWLLHEGNSPLQPDDAIIIVLSPALRKYIANTLPRMGIHGVKIFTFSEFASRALQPLLPRFFDTAGRFHRPETPLSSSISRVKRSLALLSIVEDLARSKKCTSCDQVLLAALAQTRNIIELDETRLLSEELVLQTRKRTEENFAHNALDADDEPLLVRAAELLSGGISRSDSPLRHYGHIVVDEVQDSSPAEISAVLGAVQSPSHVTLVGDTSQQLTPSSGFPGWEKLRSRWAFKDAISTFVSLSVSHRSTLPIMQLADAIQDRTLVTEGRPGRLPIWFRCRTEPDALQAAREWLAKAMERYPSQVTAVICATTADAKYLKSLLAPTFGGALRLGDEHTFSFEEGIVVTTVKDTKGLEFTNVLIWNPSEFNYPSSSPEARNALYVAVTRAEENLSLVTCKAPSRLLPPFHSPLLRPVDLRPEEERATG